MLLGSTADLPEAAEFVDAAVNAALSTTAAMWRLSVTRTRRVPGLDPPSSSNGLFGLPRPPPPSYQSLAAAAPGSGDEGPGGGAVSATSRGAHGIRVSDGVGDHASRVTEPDEATAIAIGAPLLLAMPAAMQARAADLTARQKGLAYFLGATAATQQTVGGACLCLHRCACVLPCTASPYMVFTRAHDIPIPLSPDRPVLELPRTCRRFAVYDVVAVLA